MEKEEYNMVLRLHRMWNCLSCDTRSMGQHASFKTEVLRFICNQNIGNLTVCHLIYLIHLESYYASLYITILPETGISDTIHVTANCRLITLMSIL